MILNTLTNLTLRASSLNLGDLLGQSLPWNIVPVPDGTPAELTNIYLKNIIVVVFFVLLILWVGMAALAGYRYIISRGDPDKQKAAMLTLKHLLIGAILTFVVMFLVSMIISSFTV